MNKELKLEEFEEICPKCKGNKKIRPIDFRGTVAPFEIPCDRCNATGKIDWIQKILGTKIDGTIKDLIYCYEELNEEIEKYKEKQNDIFRKDK